MVAYAALLTLTTTLLASLTTAAPCHCGEGNQQDNTYNNPPLPAQTGAIKRITVGSTTANNGLSFEPENVRAAKGDILEFHFLPKNHTIVQSSFDKPCVPLEGGKGVFSGFNFATKEGEAKNVFRVEVTDDTKPMWLYCSQGNHCQKGMSMVVNQPEGNGEKTLAKYKEASAGTKTGQPSENPTASQGGEIKVNDFKG